MTTCCRGRLTRSLKSSKLTAVCLLASIGACGCPDEDLFWTIGEFESRDSALQAAVPKLATAISKCPRVKTYRIVFTSPGIYSMDRHADRHALIYWRRDSPQSWIGYEDDVHSGISPGFGPYEVTDADVHAVAAKGGALDDFARLDRGRK